MLTPYRHGRTQLPLRKRQGILLFQHVSVREAHPSFSLLVVTASVRFFSCFFEDYAATSCQHDSRMNLFLPIDKGPQIAAFN
jgi:hypothetical protein